jgi:murein L,D-transpeptidase YcbB/YkuD
VSPILHEAAQTGTLTGLKWPRFQDYRNEITRLYSANGWQPVWTSNGRPVAAARSAIDVLRSAEDRGLHPEDYNAAKLDEQFGKLTSGTSSSARDVGWFDVALSVGLLRHVSDIHIGRVDPRKLSVGINIASKKLDLARELSAAIARNGIPELVRRAEPPFVQYRNLKAAYARYRVLAADTTLPTVTIKRTVHPGEPLDQLAQLRRRLVAFGDLPAAAAGDAASSTYDRLTAAAVARFQERHGIGADSVLGPATVAAINVSPAKRARQLELALERIRWLPDFSRSPFVVANVPSFQLYAFDSIGGTGTPSLQMNVVVGKADVGRKTPLFEREMQYIIFRPYWVIPPGIIANEVLPAVRRDPGYVARNDMELYSGDGDTGAAVPATGANIARTGKDLGIRQRPGPRNALGLAKFIFPNDYNVYFHGTPATELFSRSRRDFSHGCVRVEDPAGLATWILHDPRSWSRSQVEQVMNGDRSRKVTLTRPLPVVIYYTTAVVRPEGAVNFFADVYMHDALLERALAKGYPFAP